MDALTKAVATIVGAVLVVILPIVSKFAIDLIRQAIDYYDSKTTTGQRDLLSIIVKQGVLMAEQMAQNANLQGIVYDKKQEALAYIQAAVDRSGLSFHVDDIEALIEATVMSEFNKDLLTVETPTQPTTPTPPAAVGLNIPVTR